MWRHYVDLLQVSEDCRNLVVLREHKAISSNYDFSAHRAKRRSRASLKALYILQASREPLVGWGTSVGCCTSNSVSSCDQRISVTVGSEDRNNPPRTKFNQARYSNSLVRPFAATVIRFRMIQEWGTGKFRAQHTAPITYKKRAVMILRHDGSTVPPSGTSAKRVLFSAFSHGSVDDCE